MKIPITAASANGSAPHVSQTRPSRRSLRTSTIPPAINASTKNGASACVNVMCRATASTNPESDVGAIHDACRVLAWATKEGPPERNPHDDRGSECSTPLPRGAVVACSGKRHETSEQEKRRAVVEQCDEEEASRADGVSSSRFAQPALRKHRGRHADEREERVHAGLASVEELEDAHGHDPRCDDTHPTAVAHPPCEERQRRDRERDGRHPEYGIAHTGACERRADQVVERWVRVLSAQEGEEFAEGPASGHRGERLVKRHPVCVESPDAEDRAEHDEPDKPSARPRSYPADPAWRTGGNVSGTLDEGPGSHSASTTMFLSPLSGLPSAPLPDRPQLPLELLDLVAQPGRLFEPEIPCRIGHLVLQRLDQPAEIVGRDIGEVEHR